MPKCERLEQHDGRSATNHLRAESMLLSSASSFMDSMARLASEEVAAHHARLMDLGTLASDAWSWIFNAFWSNYAHMREEMGFYS